jgi:AraC-like DNA-binding protein
VQHVEFFDKEHFEFRYHRKKARRSISDFIEFFWETDFDSLWDEHPNGFSDALFPNIGYTYLINLGTPFVMQLEDAKHEIRSDGFLPRHKNMICHHTKGNKIFGIKFRISPVVFEKKVNFFDYREFIYPLAYLMEREIISKLKSLSSFEKRVELISAHYEKIVTNNKGLLPYVDIVTDTLKDFANRGYNMPVEEAASKYKISSRTLQRYFEATTSVTAKQAFQLMRIRKAVNDLIADPASFDSSLYGYYDHSHFYKHLRSFLDNPWIQMKQPHLKLLRSMEINSDR